VRFPGSLPLEKRQPSLLFATARCLLGMPASLDRLRALASQNRAGLPEVMLARWTQANESARCAKLLPALAQLPSPLALIEAGPTAGAHPAPSTVTPTITPGTGSPTRVLWRPRCAASRR